jgi:hypothetical protein
VTAAYFIAQAPHNVLPVPRAGVKMVGPAGALYRIDNADVIARLRTNGPLLAVFLEISRAEYDDLAGHAEAAAKAYAAEREAIEAKERASAEATAAREARREALRELAREGARH